LKERGFDVLPKQKSILMRDKHWKIPSAKTSLLPLVSKDDRHSKGGIKFVFILCTITIWQAF